MANDLIAFNAQNKHSLGVTLRAVVLGIVLIPVNAFWLIQIELVWFAGLPSTITLLSTVVFIICALLGLNLLLSKFAPKSALSQGELLTVYVMLAIGTTLGGCDVIQALAHIMVTAFWHATPENEWAELFSGHIPSWLTVSDKTVLRGFYEGESTFYTREHIRAWWTPALFWCCFAVVCLFVMACINVLLRKRWAEHERLAYPIIRLPYEITGGDGASRIFRNRLLWIGFAVAAGINVVNGLNFLYPQIPRIPIKQHNIGRYFTERPWNAIGWTPITFYPFAIGLGYLMPLDLGFSCWFFYLFWRVEKIIGAVLGWYSLPGFPFHAAQIAGVWLGILGFTLWGGRRYFYDIGRKVLTNTDDVDDSNEPMRYRHAVIGILIGMGLIAAFCNQAGMSLWVTFAFFILYFGISTAITRIRAELGPPVQDLRDSGPDYILTTFLGVRRFSKGDLSLMSLFFWINGESYRGHTMPHQLEGFKLAERANMNSRRLLIAMTIATAIAAISAFWCVLHFAYRFGSSVNFNGPAARYYGFRPYRRLAIWLSYPAESDVLATSITGISLLSTLTLLILRTRVFWWPLHPMGYAISYSWAMNLLWFPLLISTVAKFIILKHVGVRAYRRTVPLFLGFILGEYLVGGIWSILGMILDRRMYAFWV